MGRLGRTRRERMIREVFLLAPKKSSKTSYGAALMETTLLMNERPRAEFLLIAPTVSLAHIAFSQALGMVEKDPDGFLQKRMHIQEHLRKITDRRTKATLEIKAFDTSVLTGVKPTGVLLDELHEIAKNPAAERLIGQLRGRPVAQSRRLPDVYHHAVGRAAAWRIPIRADGGARHPGRAVAGRHAADPLRIPGGHRQRPRQPARVAGSEELVDGHAQPGSVSVDRRGSRRIGRRPSSRGRARSFVGPRSTSTSRSAWRCDLIAGRERTSGSRQPITP